MIVCMTSTFLRNSKQNRKQKLHQHFSSLEEIALYGFKDDGTQFALCRYIAPIKRVLVTNIEFSILCHNH